MPARPPQPSSPQHTHPSIRSCSSSHCTGDLRGCLCYTPGPTSSLNHLRANTLASRAALRNAIICARAALCLADAQRLCCPGGVPWAGVLSCGPCQHVAVCDAPCCSPGWPPSAEVPSWSTGESSRIQSQNERRVAHRCAAHVQDVTLRKQPETHGLGSTQARSP